MTVCSTEGRLFRPVADIYVSDGNYGRAFLISEEELEDIFISDYRDCVHY